MWFLQWDFATISITWQINTTSYTVVDMNFPFPSLADNIIRLLAIMTGDEQEWIYYWVYDLNCGKDSDKYRVTDKNGNIIPLTSIQDLWNLLVEQAEDNN